jgi:Asp-tRNA(Asn)/Glu-tRNA(Gln) amidotransferase B subunit
VVNLPIEILQLIQSFAKDGKVSFTYKAVREIAMLEIGLDETDVCEILKDIETSDFFEKIKSKTTDEWMYVFKVTVAVTLVYLKLILRDNCIVISCHEDRPYE